MQKINAVWTRQMVEDLRYLGIYFKYITKEQHEIDFITKNFTIELIDYNSIYFTINNKNKRKLKLIVLNDSKTQKLIDKILKNSTHADIQDILEKKLSMEISKEIDKEIIKNLMAYIKETP